MRNVAPFAGAWIEIGNKGSGSGSGSSLPSRERGLKYAPFCHFIMIKLSLPSRERGLKFPKEDFIKNTFSSLPSRERGLKYRH